MCGLTGFLARGPVAGMAEIASSMADRLLHRGPDDGGAWCDEEAGIALAHRRLSILDLSPAGHQPMVSASGRWVIAYNGELYNHVQLRREMESAGRAPAWRGHSDTETLLACIEAWGVERALRRGSGMFALALWDRGRRELWLARDRFGEKPLYYGWQGETFLFGSELKALRAHPAFAAGVDRGALALLLRNNCIPAPHSIHSGIRKLPPGTWLRLAPGGRDAEPVQYWSLAEVAERGMANPFAGDENEAVDELERRLGAAVRAQMLSDAPLGALLSGGIDSSTIVALMQVQGDAPVRTFTIGFGEQAYDEAAHARGVARHLGTQHTEARLDAEDALALIPALPLMYDEPFADSSQLPAHLVMRIARRAVAVALSGDGGDELFGGYNRYRFLPNAWRILGRLPNSVRQPALAVAKRMPAALGRVVGAVQVEGKLAKLGRAFDGAPRGIDDLYVATVGEWRNPERLVVEGSIPANTLDARDSWPRLRDPVARMMALDAMTYLPDDLLAKVDRAAMAVSLEARAPFLDPAVTEFAWSLPMSMKIRDGKGKWIVRRLLDRHVPRSLIDRPKMGFGVPLDHWLRGPLREWAAELLCQTRLRREGYLQPSPIREAWNRHLAGDSLGHRLWSVLMFQAWLEEQGRAI